MIKMELKTEWTKEEFIAYLLLYAAKADQIITKEELDIVHSKVNNESYEKIKAEIEQDNDYQSSQKILFNIEQFNFSKNDIETLMKEIKTLFLSDGKYDILEKNMYLALSHLLNNN